MINKLKLQNWKSHIQTDLEFKPGVNILIGNMGAGKSSILQAISFALFGTFSEVKSKDLRLADLITRRSESKRAEVDLQLDFGDKKLSIKRQIEATKGTSEAAVRDETNTLLAGPNPTQVSDYITNTLKLNEDIFLRTVYARQNDIDILLQLTPMERKKRLDDLMGLDKFELARKNAIKLLNQITVKKEAKEVFLKDTNVEQVDRDVLNLENEQNKTKVEFEEIKAKITSAHEEKRRVEELVRELRKKFDEFNKLQERRNTIRKQFEEISSKQIDLDTTTEKITELIRETKTKLSEAVRTKLNAQEDLEQSQKDALELEKSLGGIEQRYFETNNELDNIQKLKQELENLKKAGEVGFERKILEEIEGKIREILNNKQFLMGEVGVLRKHLEELEKAEGLCPVCSSNLDARIKDNLVRERKLKIDEQESTIIRLTAEVEEMHKKRDNMESVYETYNSYIKKIESESDLRKKERELALQLSEVKGKRYALQGVISQMQKRFNNLDESIRNLEIEQTKLIEQRQLCEVKEKRDALQKELETLENQIKLSSVDTSELERTDKNLQECIRMAQELVSKQDSLAFIIEEKEKRLNDLKSKKEQIASIKKDIHDFESKIEFLSKFKNGLLFAQESMRKELIIAVNEVMTDIWNNLYPYDYWTSVRLQASDSDYILQLKEKEGEWITVSGFASGGERMLACLALRMAFAKIMAPGLSLLILDEPTHNLDDRAIQSFVELLQEKLSKFLDQIFIVTHDEKLAEAGDNIIKLQN